MTWYQYKEEYPTNGLPQRIRLDDGSTRTSLWRFSDDEIILLGIKVVPDPPYYNQYTQDLIWNNEDRSWSITTTKDPEKIRYGWEQNEYYKRELKIRLLERVSPFIESGGSISTYYKASLDVLSGITSSNYPNPFQFNWQNPSVIGYTPEVVSKITKKENGLINHAFVDFMREVYLPNQKY